MSLGNFRWGGGYKKGPGPRSPLEFEPPGNQYGKAIERALKEPIGKVRHLCLKCKKIERIQPERFCKDCQ